MYEVTLPREQPVEFPDTCIACQRDSPGWTMRMPFSTSRQAEGTPLVWLLPRIAIDVPACTKCGVRLRLGRWLRQLLQWVVIGGSMAAAYFLLRHRLEGMWLPGAVLAISFAAMVVYTVIEQRLWPPPFDITVDRDTIDYEFRDPTYARRFAGINSGLKQALGKIADVFDRIDDDQGST